MSDDDVIAALAHASREKDPLIANVLATEAMNRMRRSRIVARSIGEGVLGFNEHARINYADPAAQFILGKDEGELLGRAWSEAIFDRAFVVTQCPVTAVI